MSPPPVLPYVEHTYCIILATLWNSSTSSRLWISLWDEIKKIQETPLLSVIQWKGKLAKLLMCPPPSSLALAHATSGSSLKSRWPRKVKVLTHLKTCRQPWTYAEKTSKTVSQCGKDDSIRVQMRRRTLRGANAVVFCIVIFAIVLSNALFYKWWDHSEICGCSCRANSTKWVVVPQAKSVGVCGPLEACEFTLWPRESQTSSLSVGSAILADLLVKQMVGLNKLKALCHECPF